MNLEKSSSIGQVVNMVVINWSDFHQQCKETSKYLCNEDRISELPSDILIHILSFLTLKESAITSILSKAWRNTWSSVNRLRLDFDARKIPIKEEDILPDTEEIQKLVDTIALYEDRFVELVNNTLMRYHKSTVIDEFRIRFGLHDSSENDINNWLEFAFAKRVQTLELNLLFTCHTEHASLYAYGFPNRIVDQRSNESSKESPPLPPVPHPDFLVHQNGHILKLHDFDSLISLSLAHVNVSGEVLTFLLKKCRNLERIKVCTCNTLFSLEVCGTFPALKYLEICHCFNLKNIVVRETNLVSLKLHRVRVSILENNPKLVEVCLDNSCMEFSSVTLPLLISGSRVQILTLDVTFFTAVQAHQITGLSQLTELKQLTLNMIHVTSTFTDLMHLTSLIRLSPKLETFVLQLERAKNVFREDRPLKKGLKIPLEHLKTIEFRGYCGCEAEDELIMFFVENAICLETIIIDPCGMKVYPRLRDLLAEKESIRQANKLKEVIPSTIKLTTKNSTMQEYSIW